MSLNTCCRDGQDGRLHFLAGNIYLLTKTIGSFIQSFLRDLSGAERIGDVLKSTFARHEIYHCGSMVFVGNKFYFHRNQ